MQSYVFDRKEIRQRAVRIRIGRILDALLRDFNFDLLTIGECAIPCADGCADTRKDYLRGL